MRTRANVAVGVLAPSLALRPPIRSLTRRSSQWWLAILVLSVAPGGVIAPGLVSGTQSAEPAPTARVWFAHPQLPVGGEVLVDDRFIGDVGRGSYMEVELAPGHHLISGRWAHFRSGKAYCMVWTTEGWMLDMVGEEPIAVAVASLERVGPGEQALTEAQQERYRRKYEKAVRKAGDPISSRPPVRFTGVHHRQKFPKKMGGLMADHFKGGFGKRRVAGALVVDKETLRFESKQEELELPVGEILSFRFRGYVPSGPDPWLEILHGDLEGPRSDFFSSDAYETLFDALVQVTGHG